MYRLGGAENGEDGYYAFLMEQIRNPQRSSHGTIQALAMACKSECTLLEDCPFVKKKLKKAQCKTKSERMRIWKQVQELVSAYFFKLTNSPFPDLRYEG